VPRTRLIRPVPLSHLLAVRWARTRAGCGRVAAGRIRGAETRGLSDGAILDSATREGATWLGFGGDRGAVEVGKRADLILLTADPMADVANSRPIAAVIVSGRLFSRAELDSRMADLKRRYEVPGR
jgi:cytosine/adenosine deaminase-related metal-dependent hydrolase